MYSRLHKAGSLLFLNQHENILYIKRDKIMKKLLLIVFFMAGSNLYGFDNIKNTIGNIVPTVITDGAKTGAAMILGLEKKHNLHVSLEKNTLALLVLIYREQLNLTHQEAELIKKKLLEYILASQENQPTTAVSAENAIEAAPTA